MDAVINGLSAGFAVALQPFNLSLVLIGCFAGTLIGALLGVFVISLINTAVVFYNIDPNYSRFVTGCVILGAIALDRFLKRRNAAKP